jgi:hypothetical protein
VGFQVSTTAVQAFFAARWHGDLPIRRLFWWDMLATATFLNLVFVFVALILLAKRLDPALSMAVIWLPVPYNLFLVSCLWRHPETTFIIRGVAVAWVLLFLAI